MPAPLPEERLTEIGVRHERGQSNSTIAKSLGVPTTTISRIIKRRPPAFMRGVEREQARVRQATKRERDRAAVVAAPDAPKAPAYFLIPMPGEYGTDPHLRGPHGENLDHFGPTARETREARERKQRRADHDGLEGWLDRKELRAERMAEAIRANRDLGLSDAGFALVRTVDEIGRLLDSTPFDPRDLGDVRRAAAVTGFRESYLLDVLPRNLQPEHLPGAKQANAEERRRARAHLEALKAGVLRTGEPFRPPEPNDTESLRTRLTAQAPGGVI